jgi:membrane protease subunit HflK
VEGEIQALRAKFAAYTQAPDVTRNRLYLEAMEAVMGNVDDKVIIDSSLDQILPLLQLPSGDSK